MMFTLIECFFFKSFLIQCQEKNGFNGKKCSPNNKIKRMLFMDVQVYKVDSLRKKFNHKKKKKKKRDHIASVEIVSNNN